MPLYQAIILAVIQGVAEFLPISSTAHLVLFPWVLGWKDPGLTFDVALHAGTLVAVVLYFWQDWLQMILAAVGLGAPSDPEAAQRRRLFWYLVIATVPAGIAGLLFEKAAEEQFRQPIVIGLAMIIVALVMWAGEHTGDHRDGVESVSFASAFIIGVSQALAVIPGVSRSGITMSTGLFRGLKREAVARFSFLLSTPIIAGAAAKKALEIHKTGLPADMHLPFLAGIAVSAVVGYGVIAWLLRYLSRRTFKVFIIYRLALGVLVLALGWGLHR
jgi:undecaprenyl-diphosphatase